MPDFDDEKKILKVNFKEKRPKPGAKQRRGDFLQTKTAGIVVVVLLIAAIYALNIALPSP